jgi:hypothetical protein
MSTTPPNSDQGEKFSQVKHSVTLSRRNVRAVGYAMVVNDEKSFSHAVDTIITEAMTAGVPFFKGPKR